MFTRRPSKRLVAIFLMIGAVIAFTLVDSFSKALTARHAPVVVMFMQYGLSALMMLPLALGKGQAGFRIIAPRLLIVRAVIGVVVSFLIVTSLSLLSFTVAAALLQLETFFFIPMAIVILKERADWRRWLAVGLGLAGAFLILRPGTDAFQMAGLVALAGAVALALKNVVLKQVAMSEATVPALFWMYVLMSAIAAIPAWFMWRGMSLADFGLFLISAVLVNTSNYFMLRAFSMADAVQLTPALHTGLPVAVLIGLVVFGEWPAPIVWAGIALIFLATFMPSGPRKSE